MKKGDNQSTEIKKRGKTDYHSREKQEEKEKETYVNQQLKEGEKKHGQKKESASSGELFRTKQG